MGRDLHFCDLQEVASEQLLRYALSAVDLLTCQYRTVIRTHTLPESLHTSPLKFTSFIGTGVPALKHKTSLRCVVHRDPPIRHCEHRTEHVCLFEEEAQGKLELRLDLSWKWKASRPSSDDRQRLGAGNPTSSK